MEAELESLRAENKRLRATLAKSTAKNALFLFQHSPTRRRLLTAFRQWLVNVKKIETLSWVSREVVSLQTQRLHLESQRTIVNRIEEDNSILRGNLFLTLYFYRWKLLNCEKQIKEERAVHKAQLESLMSEIKSLKSLVSKKNQQEAGLVGIAKERGADFVNTLHKLGEIMNECTLIHTIATEEGEKEVDLPQIEDHAQVLLASSFNSSGQIGDSSSVPLSTAHNSFFASDSFLAPMTTQASPKKMPHPQQVEQLQHSSHQFDREEKEYSRRG